MGMSLMGTDDVGELIGNKEIVNGRHAEAHAVPPPQGRAKAVIVEVHLLLLIGRVTPYAVGGHLLRQVSLVLVARVHRCHVRHSQDGLDGVLVVGHRAGDPSVDAEHIVVNDSSQRKAVEALVYLLPDTLAQVLSEAGLHVQRGVVY